ncbi:MAG: type II toxin-antitoxin system RelE family toxin [Desulfomonilaceae bacterium]
MNSIPVTYIVDFDRCVSKELASIPAETTQKILVKIKSLEKGPHPRGCKKISGSQNMFRLRQGQYRIIYLVDTEHKIISIVSVAHRRNAYRNI